MAERREVVSLRAQRELLDVSRSEMKATHALLFRQLFGAPNLDRGDVVCIDLADDIEIAKAAFEVAVAAADRQAAPERPVREVGLRFQPDLRPPPVDAGHPAVRVSPHRGMKKPVDLPRVGLLSIPKLGGGLRHVNRDLTQTYFAFGLYVVRALMSMSSSVMV